MQSISQFIAMFVVLPPTIGALARLSSRILRYETVSWKQGYLFGIFVSICTVVGLGVSTKLSQSLPTAGYRINLIVPIVNFFASCWYLSNRGTNPDTGTFGWSKAIKLSGLIFIMLGAFGGLLKVIAKILIGASEKLA